LEKNSCYAAVCLKVKTAMQFNAVMEGKLENLLPGFAIKMLFSRQLPPQGEEWSLPVKSMNLT
jgi:hypothetical protein